MLIKSQGENHSEFRTEHKVARILCYKYPTFVRPLHFYMVFARDSHLEDQTRQRFSTMIGDVRLRFSRNSHCSFSL